MRIKRIGIIFVIICSMLMMTGCKSEFEKVSKSLTTYDITAQFDAETMTVTAKQKVTYVNNYDVPLSAVKFHLYPNAFREGAIYCPAVDADYPNGKSYGGISVENVSVDGKAAAAECEGVDQNMLSVALMTELYPTAKVTIEMDFSVKLPNLHHRFGYGEKAVNLGNWYPVAAVYKNGEFLCDPYYKNGDPFFSSSANYNVTLSMPESYKAAASGKQKSAKTADGITTTTYKAQVMRDFALVLSDCFEVKSGAVDKITVDYYYYDDTDPDASLKTSLNSIETFNKMFGKYPYQNYSVVETHFSSAGMEYPGLVYVNDTLARKEYDMVIIHETAHQWWYGVVGNDEVRDAWIDEALTEYSTTMFYEERPEYGITKSERIMESFKTYMSIAQVFEVINGKIDTSMNRPVNEYNTVTEYACMVYVKGQLMYDSIRNLVGKADFEKGLKSYYKNNMYKIAGKAELIGAFEAGSGMDLGGVFDAWLEGKIIIADLYSSK